MRGLKTIVIVLFVIIAIAFVILFCYDRLVLDHVPPKIICDGARLEVSVRATDEELRKGLMATDDVDGDITDRIIVRKVSRLVGSNSAVINYAVFDNASNFSTFSRNIYYTDYYQPRYSLSQPMIFNVNSLVTLVDRLTAYDVIDGDISARIRLSAANISTSVEGEYPLSLQVTNSTGDTSPLALTVQIRNYTSRHPVIYLSEYLTYAELGSEVDLEKYRDLIIGARENVDGPSVNYDDIMITGKVDTSHAGSYDVKFSYINRENLSYNVILTVVVQ